MNQRTSILCLHVGSHPDVSPVVLSPAVKPCAGAAQHEGGGQTKLSGRPVGWSGPRPSSVPGRDGLCWPAAKLTHGSQLM